MVSEVVYGPAAIAGGNRWANHRKRLWKLRKPPWLPLASRSILASSVDKAPEIVEERVWEPGHPGSRIVQQMSEGA
jgi:hypothetical protein